MCIILGFILCIYNTAAGSKLILEFGKPEQALSPSSSNSTTGIHNSGRLVGM